jgi:hypothetical protein
MPGGTRKEAPVTTVDVRALNTLMWGPIRAMFPSFAEEIELARYLKRVLAHQQCKAVQIERHRDVYGQRSSHIYDVFLVSESSQVD